MLQGVGASRAFAFRQFRPFVNFEPERLKGNVFRRGKGDGLLSQGGGEEVSAAFAERRQGCFCIARRGLGIRQIGKHRISLRDYVAGFGFINPFAEQDKKGVPCARKNGLCAFPVIAGDQYICQMQGSFQMVAREGLDGLDRQGRLISPNGLFEIFSQAPWMRTLYSMPRSRWVMAQSCGKASRVRTVKAAS